MSRANQVHPTAVVAATAHLEADVAVGPFAVIGDGVRIGRGTRIGAHAVLDGELELGVGNVVGPHAVLGGAPQLRGATEQADERPAGRLVIGDGNVIRELSTIHVGGPGGVTSIGSDNLLMAYCHVGHDCRLGEGNELANGAQLAGHVDIGSFVTIGGLAALHQCVAVGDYALIGGGAMVAQDVPPFCKVSGDRARVYGLNSVGLQRRGFDGAQRQNLDEALRQLLAAPLVADGVEALRRRYAGDLLVESLARFAERSRRGMCRPVGPR